MDWIDAVVKLLVGLFALAGVGFTGWLGWKQFSIKRSDEKEEKSIQLQIDNAIKNARTEITKEIKNAVDDGIVRCGVIGDKAIRDTQSDLEKQIEANSKQIGELTNLTKDVLTNMDSINKVVTISAESQRNSNYDRLLIVTNKILKSGKMTIGEKTNLRQLYESWKALKGEDPKMDTKYDECLKISPTIDESA